MEVKSNNGDIAMMFGLIPCFAAPNMVVGRVSTPAPLTKFVMIKSSSEMIKASKKPEIIPGINKGSNIRRNESHRLAYKSCAACS